MTELQVSCKLALVLLVGKTIAFVFADLSKVVAAPRQLALTPE